MEELDRRFIKGCRHCAVAASGLILLLGLLGLVGAQAGFYSQALAVGLLAASSLLIFSILVFTQVRARKALHRGRHASQEIEILYNRLPCGYHSLDAEGRVLNINDTELEWLGYQREEVVGRINYRDLLTPASARIFDEAFPNFKRLGSIQGLELELLGRREHPLKVLLSALIERDGQGEFLRSRSILFDITELRVAERKIHQFNHDLARQNRELAAVNRELEAFSYSVSHDLRAPLRALDGFSQALTEDYGGRLDATARDYLQRIRGAAQNMGQLIDDLLKLSRINRDQLRPQSLDLSEMARQIVIELREGNPARQVEVDIEPDLTADGDRQLIRTALTNLLENAWKFTADRDPARIHFGQQLRDDERVYYVKDNGVGFDMAYHDKLFGAFQRLHDNTRFPGSGIGLATVQRVVHRHGGRIWAEGAADKGATFYFSLPQQPVRTDET